MHAHVPRGGEKGAVRHSQPQARYKRWNENQHASEQKAAAERQVDEHIARICFLFCAVGEIDVFYTLMMPSTDMEMTSDEISLTLAATREHT